MSTVFGAVADVLGVDKSLELMEALGGHVFYIPIKPARLMKIKSIVEHKRKIGWSEDQIVDDMVRYFNLSNRTIKNRIKTAEKVEQGGLFD